jgi:hypothetical protein
MPTDKAGGRRFSSPRLKPGHPRPAFFFGETREMNTVPVCWNADREDVDPTTIDTFLPTGSDEPTTQYGICLQPSPICLPSTADLFSK